MLIKASTLPKINIVGCGALGSKVADVLGRLGIQATIYDFDRVESKNVGNQLFRPQDVGKLKVDAVVEIVEMNSGIRHIPKVAKVFGKLNGITFVMVDTVEGRLRLLENNRYNFGCKLFIECRMDIFDGRIYAYDPKDGHQADRIKGGLQFMEKEDDKDGAGSEHEEDDEFVSVCGIRQDLATTSNIISGLAVQKLIYWSLLDQGRESAIDDPMVNELLLSFKNGMLVVSESVWTA